MDEAPGELAVSAVGLIVAVGAVMATVRGMHALAQVVVDHWPFAVGAVLVVAWLVVSLVRGARHDDVEAMADVPPDWAGLDAADVPGPQEPGMWMASGGATAADEQRADLEGADDVATSVATSSHPVLGFDVPVSSTGAGEGDAHARAEEDEDCVPLVGGQVRPGPGSGDSLLVVALPSWQAPVPAALQDQNDQGAPSVVAVAGGEGLTRRQIRERERAAAAALATPVAGVAGGWSVGAEEWAEDDDPYAVPPLP